jgi:CheY-like chemotaxis protein
MAGVPVADARSLTLPERAMRLLCADDEPDIRAILRLALSLDPEMEVEIVDSGHAAITRAAAGGFDAILLDGMMPGLDGYETCRILKSDPATAHVPVVFLTAKTQRDEARRAISVGAVACLTKPFDPMHIGRELRAALGAARPA